MSARPRRTRVYVVWGVLAVLVAAIAAVELAERRFEETAHETVAKGGTRDEMLVPIESTELGAVEIGHAGTLHRFEKDAKGLWFYHAAHAKVDGAHGHQFDTSQSEKIAAAFQALGRAKKERHFPFDPKANTFGVAPPQIVILVYRPGEAQPLAQFAVGDVAPDTFSRYVLTVGGTDVVTIPDFQIQNLLAMVQSVSATANQAAAATPPAADGKDKR